MVEIEANATVTDEALTKGRGVIEQTGRVRQQNHVRIAMSFVTRDQSPHFPDEPSRRVVIGKNTTYLSLIHAPYG